MEFIFLIQARLGSTRLPKKVLKSLFNELTLIEVIYNRLMLSKFANKNNVYVLTSENKIDDELVDFLISKNIKYYRGSEENVFSRYQTFLKNIKLPIDYFFRICSDNPFLEPLFIDNMCEYISNSKLQEDYVSYKDFDNSPIILKKYGMFCELVKKSTFLSKDVGIDKTSKENVTSFLYESKLYKTKYFEIPFNNIDFSLCIDTREDYLKSKELYKFLNKINFNYLDVIDAIE